MAYSTSLFQRKLLPLVALFAAILTATYFLSPQLFEAQITNLVVNGPVLILAFAIGGYISNKFMLHDVEMRMIRAFKTVMQDKTFQHELQKQFDVYFGDLVAKFRKEAEAYIIQFAKVIKKEVVGDDDDNTPSPLTGAE